jgi:hypothetical protein
MSPTLGFVHLVMLRVLSSIVCIFILASTSVQSQSNQAFPTNSEEIVKRVNSGEKSWESNDSLRFKVLQAFIATKQKNLPQLPDSNWDDWLLTQSGLPSVEAHVKLAVFRSRQGKFSLANSSLELANNELISIEKQSEK